MNSEELREAYGKPLEEKKETWDERKRRENAGLSFADRARSINIDKSSFKSST